MNLLGIHWYDKIEFPYMQHCTLEIINQCSFPARVHYLLLRHIFWFIYNCWHKNIVVIFTWKEILYVYFYKFCYKCFLKLFSIIIILFKLVSCMNDTFYIFHKKNLSVVTVKIYCCKKTCNDKFYPTKKTNFLWWPRKCTAARKYNFPPTVMVLPNTDVNAEQRKLIFFNYLFRTC